MCSPRWQIVDVRLDLRLDFPLSKAAAGLPALFQATGPAFHLETQNQGLWFDPTTGSSNDVAIIAGFESGMPNAGDFMFLWQRLPEWGRAGLHACLVPR